MAVGDAPVALPNIMLTRPAHDAGGALDAATSLILPSGDLLSLEHQLKALSAARVGPQDCLGLWLGRHQPPSQAFLSALGESALGWVTNFPCASQFGDGFGQQLSEVGTGFSQEVAALTAFRAQGKRVMLTMTPSPQPLRPMRCDAVLLVIRSAEDLKELFDGFLDRLRRALPPDVPVVVHGGPDGHLPRAPATQGFDGILSLPSSTRGVSSDYKVSSG